MRKPSSNDLGDFRKHLPQIERLGHRVKKATQAVDALASE